MTNSFKSTLFNYIVRNNSATLDEIYEIYRKQRHKQGTAERKLRELYHSGIQALKNEKGYIVGYRYIPIVGGEFK